MFSFDLEADIMDAFERWTNLLEFQSCRVLVPASMCGPDAVRRHRAVCSVEPRPCSSILALDADYTVLQWNLSPLGFLDTDYKELSFTVT